MLLLSREVSLNGDTQAASRTGNEAHCALDREAVEVGHFIFCDGLHLIPSEFSHLVTVGLGGTALYLGSFQQLNCNGRSLNDEGERLVVVYVITTGSTLPAFSCVRALNCLQKSMILIPLEPRAGPTGGLGFAATTFDLELKVVQQFSFAIVVLLVLLRVVRRHRSWRSVTCTADLFFLYVHKTKRDGLRASEDLHTDGNLLFLLVD